MTERERVLVEGLRSVDRSISAYLTHLRLAGHSAPLGSVFLLLDAIQKDVRKALARDIIEG